METKKTVEIKMWTAN